MTAPPPPPPGSGGNQPPPPPPPGQGPPPPPGEGGGQQPPYGSQQPPYGSQQPPYGSAPPPAQPPYGSGPGPYGPGPGGGTDSTKVLAISSMVTGIVGLVLCCCWGVPIFSVAALTTGYLAQKETKERPRGDLRAFILIGLITGAIGIVIAIVYWILVLMGVTSPEFNYDTYGDV